MYFYLISDEQAPGRTCSYIYAKTQVRTHLDHKYKKKVIAQLSLKGYELLRVLLPTRGFV